MSSSQSSQQMKKPNRTQELQRSQTAEQNALAGLEIERLLKSREIGGSVDHYWKKYGQTIERRLGFQKDDIMNLMREEIWKGLITFRSNGKANIITYLNTLIRNRFNTLLDRTRKMKFSSVEYFGNVWSAPGVTEEMVETSHTPEALLVLRESVLQEHFALTDFERLIYADLMYGRNLREMVQKHKAPTLNVVAAVLRIDHLTRERN